MAKRNKNEVIEVPVERYSNTEDIPIVTKDRDLTQAEIDEFLEKYTNDNMPSPEEAEEPMDKEPPRRGILKCKCACGRVANISEHVVEDGLTWSMLIGNEHYLTLHCDECGSTLTMFIDELPKESNEE